MEFSFWEQEAFLFITEMYGRSETSSAHTGTLACLYGYWVSLADDVRETANLRLHDRTLLDSDGIAALANRADFPFLKL